MKKSLIALCISAHFSLSAGGFPTIDVANLTQNISEYSLILKEYEQVLKQTGINTHELLTAINQYEQVLREYQVLLNQAKSLEYKIDRRDYSGITRDSLRFTEQYQGRQGSGNTQAVVNRYGSVAPKSELDTLASSALGYTPSDMSQAYTLANDANLMEHQRQSYQQRMVKSHQNIAHIDEQRVGLGEQSELATLQLMVEQNQVLIEQIATLNEVQLSNMTYSNQASQRRHHVEYQAAMKRLKAIQKANNTAIPVDERLLR